MNPFGPPLLANSGILLIISFYASVYSEIPEIKRFGYVLMIPVVWGLGSILFG